MKYYATFGEGHNGYPGCVVIYTKDEAVARKAMHDRYGDKWAFMYKNWEDVHIRDQLIVDYIDCNRVNRDEDCNDKEGGI